MPGQRILLIGDREGQVEPALAQAAPSAAITAVASVFDGVAELAACSAGHYGTILASAEPIERRPEPAVRVLRRMASGARLVLFGDPTLEPLSRKMLEHGCDDYVITPATPADLSAALAPPRLRLATDAEPAPSDAAELPADGEASSAAAAPEAHPALGGVGLAELIISVLHDQPHVAVSEALRRLNERLGPALRLVHTPVDAEPPQPEPGMALVSHALVAGNEPAGLLHLLLPDDQSADEARVYLATLAPLLGQLHALQDRHNRLQKLAITDELTGLYNARYFKHFLARVLEKASSRFFPVTLLIFDIDNFKKYNDEYGHGVGDEILRQTASLMRRCVREHDLVARLGGDEFAVVFWEKDGPRQPREPVAASAGNGSANPAPPVAPGRPPQEPERILERFTRLLATQEFPGLGAAGRGRLTISAGLAVFPWQAKNAEELIQLADRRLMFGAKRAGKNMIFLVGGEEDAGEAGSTGA